MVDPFGVTSQFMGICKCCEHSQVLTCVSQVTGPNNSLVSVSGVRVHCSHFFIEPFRMIVTDNSRNSV